MQAKSEAVGARGCASELGTVTSPSYAAHMKRTEAAAAAMEVLLTVRLKIC
jgi:hypothetical protein